jgi:hypothetical protein
MVMVGWTFKERPTTCSPTWLKLWDAPCRRAWTTEFWLLLLFPASDPTLSKVERIAALNSMPQWLSTSSSRPA